MGSIESSQNLLSFPGCHSLTVGVVGIDVMKDEDAFVVAARGDWVSSTQIKSNPVGEL